MSTHFAFPLIQKDDRTEAFLADRSSDSGLGSRSLT